MVQLGEQLLTPEKGWKRIHIDEVLKSDINNSAKVVNNQYGLKTLVCKFTGTRLRLISTLNTTKYTFGSLPIFEVDQNNIPNQIGTKEKDILTWVGSVFIDCEFAGRIYTDFGNTDKNGQTMTMMFEKLDIPDGEHLLNISIFSLNIYRKDRDTPVKDFDLDYFDIDQDGTIECFIYNEDYTREQLSKFINNNYKELVESYPNKYISCKVFYEGIYDKSNRFEYYLSDFKLVDKIPKVHPPRTNIYGTLYDLDDIFEIYNMDNSSRFNKRLIKFSFDSIMIKNRLQYLLTEDIDWNNDFYKYQNKVEDQNLGKGEANVVFKSAIIKTKFLLDLKNEGYFSGLSYWWGASTYSLYYIIRILYSKDNINWYTFNPTTRKWELCQLEDINTKGIIQFGDPYGAPGFAITSKEYKSFFNGTTKIGVALGITPNKNQYINFFSYPNMNIGFLSLLQNKSYEEISLFQYVSVFPFKPTCDTIYFIPIPNKNGKIQFLMNHSFSLIPDRNLYQIFNSNYNGLPLIKWRYMDFLDYKASDLCHILLSAPNNKKNDEFLDPEYSDYLKYIRNNSKFKQSFLCAEGLYIDEYNSSSQNNIYDHLYDYNWRNQATHFNGWTDQIHLDGCRNLSYYDYIPRLKITFEPIVNQNNIIKTNWRCIVCEHGV